MAADAVSTNPDVIDPGSEERIDGCLCGIGTDAADATPDDQLPVASGGIAVQPPPAGSDDDGDDADASAAETTADEELPVAAGGVF